MNTKDFKRDEIVIALPFNGYGVTTNGWIGTVNRIYDEFSFKVSRFSVNCLRFIPYSNNLETSGFPGFTGIIDDDSKRHYIRKED